MRPLTKFEVLRNEKVFDLCTHPITNPTGKILDLGCGPICYYFYKSKYSNYIGIDWQKPCDIIQDLSKKTTLKFANESLDFVICTQVLEHLYYPHEIISEIKRVLKKGGVAIISLPNEQEIYQRIGMLFGRKFKKGFNDIGGHRWYGDVNAARYFINKYFTKVQENYVGFFIDGNLAEKYGRYIPWSVRQFLAGLWPNMFARQIFFYCEKD